MMRNFTQIDITIDQFDAVAQIIILKLADLTIKEMLRVKPTERGEKGFGSTGSSRKTLINSYVLL